MPFDLHEDRQEAKAGVPDNCLFFAALDDFRVRQRPGLLSEQLQEDDALAHTELGSGDATSVAGGRAPVGERVGEIFHKSSDFGSGGIFNRQRDLAELDDPAEGQLWSIHLPVLSSLNLPFLARR